jgi:hypothetical protein
MSEMHRLRPGRPNPARFQGGLQHYHVAPQRQNISWEQWIGGKHRSHRWFWLMSFGVFTAITAVVAALWR